MPAKPNARNWNDVQTAIATVSIVTTLGMWNLFAAPAKPQIVQSSEPVVPPIEPPVDFQAAASMPTAMPPVKIMFTPGATQTIQSVTNVQQAQTTKKKKNKNNGGGGTVTKTKTS